jgi:hypothetical protein
MPWMASRLAASVMAWREKSTTLSSPSARFVMPEDLALDSRS